MKDSAAPRIFAVMDDCVGDLPEAGVRFEFTSHARALLTGAFFRRIRRLPPCREFVLVVPNARVLRYGFFLLGAVRGARARKRFLMDAATGERVPVTAGSVTGAFVRMALEVAAFPFLLLATYAGIGILEILRLVRGAARQASGPDVAYVFLPFNFSRRGFWGGAAAHMRGVVRGLARHDLRVHAISSRDTEDFPADAASVETVMPWRFGAHIPNLPLVLYNVRVALAGRRRFHRHAKPAFVYHRHLLFSVAGVWLAFMWRRPLVLEYNGSEVWMAKHWGGGRTFLLHIARWMESLAVRAADLLVVVSERVKEELLARGVPEERILVNFNAVDADEFSPRVEGRVVRARHGFGESHVVVGFIGTFSPWHGVEVMAESVRHVVEARPEARFLWVGDGPLLSEVKARVARDGCADKVIFTGRVAPAEAPAHLAACDILLSPHVHNPDGSAFFGSPTKLFEYMAMGRAIVASGIEQIAQVLEHGRTALLVPPGDARALADAVIRLVGDAPLRNALGGAARREAEEHHTWERHVHKTLRALRGLTEGIS